MPVIQYYHRRFTFLFKTVACWPVKCSFWLTPAFIIFLSFGHTEEILMRDNLLAEVQHRLPKDTFQAP